MSNLTDLSKLDFDSIKTKLKEFMESQDEFTDYDFDGSGLSVMLDVLAYNTQYNAMLAHINLNETFLDTAKVRSSVVSHAQQLGYIPKSRTSSEISVDVHIQGNESSNSPLTIKRGQKFSGKINNQTYTFITLTPYSAIKATDNSFKFSNVNLYEGELKSISYRIDGLNKFAKYEIPSDNVDMTTLSVKVFPNPNTEEFSSYTYYEDITEIGSDSEAFYYRENSFGRYEVYFGDNFLGGTPPSGAVVKIEYVDCNGKEANNIRTLSANDSIDGESSIVVSLSEGFTKTFNGAERENIDSIRFNAPIKYSSQNRAVTADDYRSLVLNQFENIQDVAVWGGEDNDPPAYGKVFIAPALKNEERVTSAFMNSIKNFLKTKNIGAITTEVVPAEYTNLAITVQYKYDLNKTVKTAGELKSIVYDTIVAHNDKNLNRFNGVLRSSNLLCDIDDADPGILNSIIKLKMFKSFRPNPLKNEDYIITFSNPIYVSSEEESTLESSTFFYNGVLCALKDEPLVGQEPLRNIYMVDTTTGYKVTGATSIGTVNPSKGTVTLNNLKFDLSNEITLTVKPDSFDIAPKYKQLIRIVPAEIVVEGESDSVSILGSTGLSGYTTFSRH